MPFHLMTSSNVHDYFRDPKIIVGDKRQMNELVNNSMKSSGFTLSALSLFTCLLCGELTFKELWGSSRTRSQPEECGGDTAEHCWNLGVSGIGYYSKSIMLQNQHPYIQPETIVVLLCELDTRLDINLWYDSWRWSVSTLKLFCFSGSF